MVDETVSVAAVEKFPELSNRWEGHKERCG